MPATVAIVATLDTKGDEVAFLKERISRENCSCVVVDVGILRPPTLSADITRDQVARAGGISLSELLRKGDRRLAVETMTQGAARLMRDLLAAGKLSGIVSVGGGTGTHMGTGVMRGLPLGVPKLMVSTVASRDMSALVGTKDITMMHSVIDILGLNAVSRKLLENAAAAIAGMARNSTEIVADKPIVGLTSFGFVTQGAMQVKGLLEEKGYDVAPFHANGTGGMAMEDLVEQGLISGVLDFVLHEFADQLYGGYCGAIGPGRLETAGKKGVPQLIIPGGLDCIVLEFDTPETMPPEVKGRKVFWYDFRSGVRTVEHDLIRLAQTISVKLNAAKGPTKVLIPLGGWSEADAPGGPLHDPEKNTVFTSHLKSLISSDVEILETDAHINDPDFAETAVAEFHKLMLLQK
ncbi:MAG TPA: Tm-1-like ATP-binding domain-containing protein [Desulfomonilaceae bacterium]|nr:Tm-1-like ATP-binding domain-containing protein [Desulfomonilaceae bacterium]